MGSYKTTKVTALVVSAGSGRRMGGWGKKQFLFLEDKPLIAHTLSPLSACGGIDSIILVVPEADIAYCEREIVERFGFKKVKGILGGGKERQDSVRIGLSAVDDSEFVLIHDGVRPFVTEKTIDKVLTAALRCGAATIAMPIRDTVKRVSADGRVEGTLAREGLWLVQTPQVFRTDCIKEAHRRAFEEGVSFTDDSGLLEWLGMPVAVVEGSLENIKITTKEDLEFAEAILMQRSKMVGRVGFGFDCHPLREGRKLILGGVQVPHSKGLYGHSDADCLVHAICDALLGSIGAGDIGMHFPDDDPAYKGINSLTLLFRVKGILDERKAVVVNIDSTIVCEAPKLSPYIQGMTRNIAETLNILEDRINIKATRGEGMGFVGRGEGIAAYAVASVEIERICDL